MKKILFCINNMKMGGIQKSLLELLIQIHNRYEITLFCINPVGELMPLLPKDISLTVASKFLQTSDMSVSESKKNGVFCYIIRILCGEWSKRFGKKIPANIVTRLMQKKVGTFDYAISFSQPVDEHQFYLLCNESVLNCCYAKKKITFIHCDFANYGGNCAYNRNIYGKFDRIAAVSDSVRKKLEEMIPLAPGKVQTVYNCHDYKKIREMSLDSPLKYEGYALVSVSRLSEEKGHIRATRVIKRLVDEGVSFSWHIIGDGPLRGTIEKEIRLLKLNSVIFMHGKQENPYRFMKNASLLFLPSFHEAAPMVYEEAMALGLPVLSTDTLSAKEMVEDRNIGWVCGNDEEEIYSTLKKILLCQSNLPNKQNVYCDNEIALKQFSALVGD